VPEHGSAIAYVINKAAERQLKKVAIAICDGLTPEHMETMAQKNLTLAQLLRETGHTIPKVTVLTRPGVNHLVRMSDNEILKLLEEVVPDNVAVLRRHPTLCASVISDLKAFATG
jgi:hypothetical protein